MVLLQSVANSRNAVSASTFVCLLFSFQRPSTTPRSERPALEPGRDAAEVARTTVLRLRRGGLLPLPSRSVKGQVREVSLERPPDLREWVSTPALLSRQAAAATSVTASAPRGPASSPSSGFPSSPAEPLRRRRVWRGLLLLPLRGSRQEEPRKSNHFFPALLSRGRVFYRSLRTPSSTSFPAAASRRPGLSPAGTRFLLATPSGCQQRPSIS